MKEMKTTCPTKYNFPLDELEVGGSFMTDSIQERNAAVYAITARGGKSATKVIRDGKNDLVGFRVWLTENTG